MLTLFAELRRKFFYSSLNLQSTLVLFYSVSILLTHKCDTRGEECNDVILTFRIRVTVWFSHVGHMIATGFFVVY